MKNPKKASVSTAESKGESCRPDAPQELSEELRLDPDDRSHCRLLSREHAGRLQGKGCPLRPESRPAGMVSTTETAAGLWAECDGSQGY